MMHSKIKAVEAVEPAARTILSSLIHTEGARLISWCGTSGLKFQFKDSNICTVVESKFFYFKYSFLQHMKLN